jgi:hypothetical protein
MEAIASSFAVDQLRQPLMESAHHSSKNVIKGFGRTMPTRALRQLQETGFINSGREIPQNSKISSDKGTLSVQITFLKNAGNRP